MSDQLLLSIAPYQLGSLLEFLKRAWRKAIDALWALSITRSISFSGTDRQTELQHPPSHAPTTDLEAAAYTQAELQVQHPPSHAPTTDLEQEAAAAADRAVSNSSGSGEEVRVSNTSNLKTIGELAVPLLACIGIYATIHADEQRQRLHRALYFLLLTFLAFGTCASLYSIFYSLAKPTAPEGRGGGGEGEEEERELVKSHWLKVALICTCLALILRVALSYVN